MIKGEIFVGYTRGVQQVPRLANPIHRLYNTGGSSGWHPVGVLVFSFTVLNEHGYFGAPIRHYCRLCEALNYNKWAFWLIKPNRIMNMFSFMLSFREEKLYEDLTDSWSRFSNCRKGFERNLKRYKIWPPLFFPESCNLTVALYFNLPQSLDTELSNGGKVPSSAHISRGHL